MRDTMTLDLDWNASVIMGQDLSERLFPSREMADYLAGQELSICTLIETINGAPVPLREKRDVLLTVKYKRSHMQTLRRSKQVWGLFSKE